MWATLDHVKVESAKTMTWNSNMKWMTVLPSWADKTCMKLYTGWLVILISCSAALTCFPSGWWQSWLRPSGCRSPAAVEWSGSPAAPSPAGTTHELWELVLISIKHWDECKWKLKQGFENIYELYLMNVFWYNITILMIKQCNWKEMHTIFTFICMLWISW